MRRGASHNFSPFLDRRPGVPADERYKALGSLYPKGLSAFASADGLRWRKLSPDPVLVPKEVSLDSQNVACWSEGEGCCVCYLRVFRDGVRWVARSTSADFRTWTPPVAVEFIHAGRTAPAEHLDTNQTAPYFRAPHLHVGLAARFMPGRRVLEPAEAKGAGIAPGYFHDTSDAVLITTRGGGRYERACLEGFVRPGIGAKNWASRTNYPALGAVQTDPDELSFYVVQDYAQPTCHLHRYSLRLDGFASVRAGYAGSEVITVPLTFAGAGLRLNFATSAAGEVPAELQEPDGRPLIGNSVERPVAWAGGDLAALAGRPVRLRLALKDADVYSFRFGAPAAPGVAP